MALNKSKLFHLVSVLTKKEVTQIRKMLKSPFFNTRNDLVDLFERLVESTKSAKVDVTRSDLNRQLYPDKKNNEAKLRAAMSDLLRLIEECWLINNYRADTLQSTLTLSKLYRKRKLAKSQLMSLNKAEHLLEDLPFRNQDYFRYQLDFQIEQMNYHFKGKRSDYLFLQEISDTVDQLFLTLKLNYTCAQLSQMLVVQADYDYGLLNHLTNQIETAKYTDHPAIAIYYYCFRFLTEPDQEDYFHKFKRELDKSSHFFTNEDLQAPYRLALNFCIRKINQGVASYIQDSWELYKTGIESGVLLENNQLSRFTFSNTVAAALKLQKHDWIQTFIETYREKLNPDFRDQTISFNLARLAFEKEEYGNALVHLQNAEYKDLINSLIAKMILIKVYVELEEYGSLESHLDSFQQYVRRREVSDYYRTNFLNIIRLTRKVITLPIYGKKEREKLQKEIETTKVLSERQWLLSKVS